MAVTSIGRPARERSVGELFGELASETGTLVRQEVKLATTELAHKATFAAKKSGLVITGAALGLVSAIALAAALILLLGLVMPYWASALIVSAALAATAYGVARAGLGALSQMDVRPTETIASLEENKTWAKRQLQ